MPSIEILLAFCLTTAVFAFIPGPAMLYTAAQTMAGGRRAGMMAALGIHIGCYVHIIAAAAGLSILFHAVPMLYMVIKLAGAAYLIWLGISMFRDKRQNPAGVPIIKKKSGRRAFIESITVEVLNPKTAIFFLAFLPQFVDAHAQFPIWLQLFILGTVVSLIFSLSDVICVFLAEIILGKIKESNKAQRLMTRLGGTVLVGLGVNVALQKT